jgi:IPT/TIG domain
MPTKVRIGPNLSRVVEVISERELIATYEGGELPGPTDVVVETSKGTAVAAGAFTVTPRPPTIEEVTPNRGPGGTQVTIYGSGFED